MKKTYLKITKSYSYDVYLYLAKHPISGIPKVHYLKQNEDKLIVLEEYIDGEDLETLIDQRGPAPTRNILHIVKKLSRILIELEHAEPPIIHRDIKPSNVILTKTNEVYLIDFDAAKLADKNASRDTHLLGTKGYAAPEQFGFGASGLNTDLYGLGVLMNTLAMGEYSETITPNTIIGPLVESCTKLDAKERFRNPEALLNAIVGEPKIKKIPWLPPGLRTLNPAHMTISLLVYVYTAFILFISTDLSYVPHPGDYLMKIEAYLGFLIGVFITFNYMKVQTYIPLCNSRSLSLRILGIIIFDICLIFFTFLFMVFTDIFFENIL